MKKRYTAIYWVTYTNTFSRDNAMSMVATDGENTRKMRWTIKKTQTKERSTGAQLKLERLGWRRELAELHARVCEQGR